VWALVEHLRRVVQMFGREVLIPNHVDFVRVYRFVF
jgi:hypothetical protein